MINDIVTPSSSQCRVYANYIANNWKQIFKSWVCVVCVYAWCVCMHMYMVYYSYYYISEISLL